jgi:hypothetical protein
MLFSGGELAEALGYAEAHPESLSNDDRLFLEKSRKMRDRMEAEVERTRKIEQQGREIAAQSQKIRLTNRLLWVFIYVCLLAIVCLS